MLQPSVLSFSACIYPCLFSIVTTSLIRLFSISHYPSPSSRHRRGQPGVVPFGQGCSATRELSPVSGSRGMEVLHVL